MIGSAIPIRSIIRLSGHSRLSGIGPSYRPRCAQVCSGRAAARIIFESVRYNQGMRVCLCVLALAALSLHATTPPKSENLRGKLVVRSGETPVLETSEHKRIVLDGDTPTRKVLHDPRVSGLEGEATGHFTAPGTFLIDPQHTRALVVIDGGKRKMITYWCDVCYIRAYAPGPCVCCQKDTDLDLRDLDDIR